MSRDVTQIDALNAVTPDRDMSRNVTRDSHAVDRDMSRGESAEEISEPLGATALSAESLGLRDSVTPRDSQRDAVRDMSRSGGLGGVGVVAVAVRETATATALVQNNNSEARLPSLSLPAREPRDMSRLVTPISLSPAAGKFEAMRSLKQRQRAQLNVGVQIVFKYWIAKFAKDQRSVLTDERASMIERQLDANRNNVSELCFAIDGLAKSPFHMGKSDRGRKFDDIQYALKDRAAIEQFAGTQSGYTRGEQHAYVAAAQEEIEALLAQATAGEPRPEVVNG